MNLGHKGTGLETWIRGQKGATVKWVDFTGIMAGNTKTRVIDEIWAVRGGACPLI